MIPFRCIYNGSLPHYDLLRPPTVEDFDGLNKAEHSVDTDYEDLAVTFSLQQPVTVDCECK